MSHGILTNKQHKFNCFNNLCQKSLIQMELTNIFTVLSLYVNIQNVVLHLKAPGTVIVSCDFLDFKIGQFQYNIISIFQYISCFILFYLSTLHGFASLMLVSCILWQIGDDLCFKVEGLPEVKVHKFFLLANALPTK